MKKKYTNLINSIITIMKNGNTEELIEIIDLHKLNKLSTKEQIIFINEFADSFYTPNFTLINSYKFNKKINVLLKNLKYSVKEKLLNILFLDYTIKKEWFDGININQTKKLINSKSFFIHLVKIFNKENFNDLDEIIKDLNINITELKNKLFPVYYKVTHSNGMMTVLLENEKEIFYDLILNFTENKLNYIKNKNFRFKIEKIIEFKNDSLNYGINSDRHYIKEDLEKIFDESDIFKKAEFKNILNNEIIVLKSNKRKKI